MEPKQPLPPIPLDLASHRRRTAAYLRELARTVEAGAVKAFDIIWSQNIEGNPVGMITIDAAKLLVPEPQMALTVHEAVPMEDYSNHECDDPECEACLPLDPTKPSTN